MLTTTGMRDRCFSLFRCDLSMQSDPSAALKTCIVQRGVGSELFERLSDVTFLLNVVRVRGRSPLLTSGRQIHWILGPVDV